MKPKASSFKRLIKLIKKKNELPITRIRETVSLWVSDIKRIIMDNNTVYNSVNTNMTV